MNSIPKPWWLGDSRVEKYMAPVAEAILRHLPPEQQATDIYNRAYEAVYRAIVDSEKQYNARNVLTK